MKKRWTALLVSAAMVCSMLGSVSAKAEDSNTYKDVLNVAYNAQPSTFDPHVVGATATREITRNVFEGLFEEDSNGVPQCQLLESYEANDDFTEYTFYLRQGVLFHNGEEMTADDVIASIDRWLSNNAIARKSIPEWSLEKIDEYTVKMTMTNPCSTLPYVFSNYAQFSAIMPASVIEEAGDANLTADQLIGTGPYMFEEWAVDNYVKLVKFDDYVPCSEESDGAWGDRTAVTDTIYLYFVTDTTTRLNGLETGEYDVATYLAYTDYQRAAAIEDAYLDIENCNSVTITMNKSEDSIMSDVRWRQVISYACNIDEIMEGAYSSNSDAIFYYPDACYFNSDSMWYTDVSSVQYQDQEKAKELLEEIGYDGTPLKMLTTETYPELYNTCLILQQQLEAVGVSVELEVLDWGTMLTTITDTTAFDLYPMNYPASSAPNTINYLTKTNSSGFTNDATLNQYILDMNTLGTLEEQTEFWYDTVMPYCAEQVFILHLGTYDIINGYSSNVTGEEQYYGLMLWKLGVTE